MFGIGILCDDTEVFLKLVEPGNATVVPVNSFVQSIIMRGAHFFLFTRHSCQVAYQSCGEIFRPFHKQVIFRPKVKGQILCCKPLCVHCSKEKKSCLGIWFKLLFIIYFTIMM